MVYRYKEGEKVNSNNPPPMATEENNQTIDDLLTHQNDTDWLIKWTEALDFDSYVNEWMEMATSGAVQRAFLLRCERVILIDVFKCTAPQALKLINEKGSFAFNADTLEAELVQNLDQHEPKSRPQSATLSEVFPRETESVF